MEEETLFLFVIYNLEETKKWLSENGNIEYRDYAFTLKRAAMQKIDRGGGNKFIRTEIDFDPIDKQMCFVIVAFFDQPNSPFLILKNQPKIYGIFLAEEEARQELEKVINGNWKLLKDKGEEFAKAEIFPTIIKVS